MTSNSTNSSNIFLASEDDHIQILGMAKQFVKSIEAGILRHGVGDIVLLNVKQLNHLIKELTNKEAIIVAMSPTGALIGFFAWTETPHFLNPDITVAQELAWWVSDSARGGNVGGDLLKVFERRTGHCHMICLSVTASSPTLDIFLKRSGYRAFESSYIKLTNETH